MATVRSCLSCARNPVRLRKCLIRLKPFSGLRPLQSFATDILGPLPRTKHRKLFIFVITDRFTKLSKSTALQETTARNAAAAFCDNLVFKYGPPETMLSDNRTKLASRLLQNVCHLMGPHDVFTSAYHPQTSCQLKQYSLTLLPML